MASRIAVHRRLAARVLSRGMGRVTGAELECVLQSGVCPGCGVWRCPECSWLIERPWDHGYTCRHRRERSQEAAQ